MNNLTRIKRHYSYILPIGDPKCSRLVNLKLEERCGYIKETSDCYESGVIKLKELLYCKLNPQNDYTHWFYISIFIIISILFFAILAKISDELAVAKLFRINESVAGVTLLALGNTVTDLFSLFTQITKHSIKTGELLAGIIASSFFVSIFISGIIIVIAPSVLSPYACLRDILFLLCLVFFIDFVAEKDNVVTHIESYIVIFFYIAYIIVIIIEQILMHYTDQKIKKELEKTIADEVMELEKKRELITRLEKSGSYIREDLKVSYSIVDDTNYERKELEQDNSLSKEFLGDHNTVTEGIKDFEEINDDGSINEQNANQETNQINDDEEISLWNQFKNSIIRFDYQSFKKSNLVIKIFIILMLPIDTFFYLIIPVVNLDQHLNGWSRLLNSFHVISLPAFMVLLLGTTDGVLVFGKIPILVISFPWSLFASLIVFYTSFTNKIPQYHAIFYIFAGVGSVYVIYIIALCISTIMGLVSIVTNLSSSFIDCTFLAFGNAIGHLVSNIQFARAGYQKMALGACFGAPIFMLGLLLGSILLGRCLVKEGGLQRFEISSGSIGKNCTVFMMFGLTGFILGMIFTNFIARKSLGIFLLTVYVMWFISIVLSEVKVIHPFGTDHLC